MPGDYKRMVEADFRVHTGTSCVECSASPILGSRYFNATSNTNLCTTCFHELPTKAQQAWVHVAHGTLPPGDVGSIEEPTAAEAAAQEATRKKNEAIMARACPGFTFLHHLYSSMFPSVKEQDVVQFTALRKFSKGGYV